MKGPGGYLKDNSNVFVSACATNFYDQCFPPETVHLGFSSTAMHWLHERLVNITVSNLILASYCLICLVFLNFS